MSQKQTPSSPFEAAADDLSLAVGQFVRRLRVETASEDLNLSQMGALARIEKGGWMTTADLARASSMKPQSMGTILAALERDGLVQRRPHPTDRRQIEFGLTADGAEARRRRSVAKRAWLVGAISKLDRNAQSDLTRAAALIRNLAE